MNHIAERNLKLLSILAFLSGFRAYEGVIAVYFAMVTGSFALGMTALAVMNLSASLFEIPTGVFSDKVGRRATMIIHYGATLLAVIVYYLADTTLVLFVGVIITGFSIAMRSGAVSGYVYENLEVLGRVDVFQKEEGYRQSLGRYALVVAGLIGTPIIYYFDIRTAILVTIIAIGIAFLLSFRLQNVTVSRHESSNIYEHIGDAWNVFRNDAVLWYVSLGKIIAYGGGNVEYRFRALFYSLFLPEWLINIVGLFNNFVTGVSMQYTHTATKRWGTLRTLLLSEACEKIVTVILILFQNVVSAFAMSLVTSTAFGIRQVGTEDVLQSRYAPSKRVTLASFIGLGSSLVFGVLGIGIGALADTIGPLYTMLALQPLLFSSTIFTYIGMRRQNHERNMTTTG